LKEQFGSDLSEGHIAYLIQHDQIIARPSLQCPAQQVVLLRFNTMIRLAFYGLLKLELPVLASGREVAATIVFDLFANLFASVILYIALDRVFNKGLD